MQKLKVKILGISLISVIAFACKKNKDDQPTSVINPESPEEVYNVNTDTTLPQYMVWWGGFNSIKMPLDSIPDGVNTVHLFLVDLDSRPEIALDTTHITMQPGVTWKAILEASHRLQQRGIKVVATVMAQIGHTTDTIAPYAESHGIPPSENNKAFSIGAITDPETYAATIKRRIIDDWQLDGVDFDCEEEVGAYGIYNQSYDKNDVAKISYGDVSNATAFFKALSKYFGPKSGSGKLMIIDRGAEVMEIVPAASEYFDRIIFQAYGWSLDRVNRAYEQNKAYFNATNMYFTLNAQRARSGWDEDTELVEDGFKQYGSLKNTLNKATEFAAIKLPGQSRTINMGIYQVSGDWSLGFPITDTVLTIQGKNK